MVRLSLISSRQTFAKTTEGVKAYSGYVHLPPNLSEGKSYNINTYFWFFEARKNPQTVPLSLWLQGGPGVPSIPAALGENGPCSVSEDSKTTILNPWSWNNEVNMLYIDQPVQVGFSYDSLINGTVNEIDSPFAVTPMDSQALEAPSINSTFFTGTFASQNNTTTANTTQHAALAIWHFMQTWTQE
jgi:carboxypeptidase C (cathepsin A)